MKIIEGKLNAKGKKIAVVVSRFNDFINKKLLEGAEDCVLRHGGSGDDIHVYFVPGAFEIPFALRRITEKGVYDGVICLATVIRGNTPHFEYVASVSFGVLTTENIEQAIERAGTKMGNKGWDAALSLIEMMDISGKI